VDLSFFEHQTFIMNKVVALLMLLSFAGFSQKKSDLKKNIPKEFEWVKKRSLVVLRQEVSVAQWFEYMASIKSGEFADEGYGLCPTPNPINFKCVCEGDKIIEPENVVYRDTTYYETKEGKKGKKRKAVEQCVNMPITGINFEQAQSYCKWLTEKYGSSDLYGQLELTFRLPTPKEMDDLLQDTFSEWKPNEDNYKAYQEGINSHGCAIYNHAHNSWCDNNFDMKNRYGYGVPMEEGLFFADMNGLYDLMGNVAEMTSEKGIAKGGSCRDQATACQPGAVNNYDGPQYWLGFRVVAELK
jgi:formylglycine-generating enzyme required for sulfatase activity